MARLHQPAVALRTSVATHGSMTPKRIILHDTECGDAQGIRELEGVVHYWNGVQKAGYGAHLIIDKDGNTAVCAPFDRVCWHTLHRNTGSIGIELVGFARFTPRMWFLRISQLRAAARWIAWLSISEGIPIRFDVERGVSRHADQSRAFGGDHFDPGKGFPLGWVLRVARKYKAQT